MVSVKPHIIFFGNERLATGLTNTVPIVLQSLLDHGHEVEAVVSRYTPGQSRSNRPLEIEVLAGEYGIPVRKPVTKQDLKEVTCEFPADIGVLAAFGMIVPQEVIEAFPHGIINLHPSLLPKYRGTTPIEQAILDGVSETGVSVMQLVPQMDAGPVLAQRTLKLDGHESKAELAASLQKFGAELIINELEDVLVGTATPRLQDEVAATFCKPLNKGDGIIDWQKTAVQLEREVRAFFGWPGSRTTLLGKEITIMQARVVNNAPVQAKKPGDHSIADGQIHIQTSDGILDIQRLKPAGKREMAAADFLRGLQSTP